MLTTEVGVERELAGDPTKGAMLRDVAYSAQARLEGFVKGDDHATNLDLCLAGLTLAYWSEQIAAAKQQGLTSTGAYRYYDFEVTDIVNDKTAAVSYCENQRKAYSKEIKTDTDLVRPVRVLLAERNDESRVVTC
ncbi:hypothetical protein [Streptomyces sp. LARHCF252]